MFESGRQHRLNVNVWSGIIGNQLIGSYILSNPLNDAELLQFLQDLDNVSLATRKRNYVDLNRWSRTAVLSCSSIRLLAKQ